MKKVPQVEYFSMSSPLSLEHYLRAPSGSIASMAHNEIRCVIKVKKS